MSAQPPPSDSVLDLRDYLTTLRLRKWWVFVTTWLILMLALLLAAVLPPEYTSTARVQATNPLATAEGLTGQAALPNMSNEVIQVKSSDVAKCAWLLMQNPGKDPSTVCAADAVAKASPPSGITKGVSTTVENTATILDINATKRKAQTAQQTSQSFAEAYVAVTTTSALDQLTIKRAPYVARRNGYSKQLSLLNARYARAIASQNPAAASYSQQITTVLGEIAQIDDTLNGTLSPTSVQSPQIVTPASSPVASNKKKVLVLAAGLVLGLLLGVALAFLVESMSDRLHGRADLERQAGANTLTVVPKVRNWRRRGEAKLLSVEDPRSPAAEAYRSLRTGILYLATQQQLRTIVVTSPGAGEGKSSTAANLAVVLAEAAKRVLLVSADLRKPRAHRFFGVPDAPGLSDVLERGMPERDAIRITSVPNLNVMACGPTPLHPAELLQSEGMNTLLDSLSSLADFVVVDTSPVLLVSDPLILAPIADGVLLVADAESTTRTAIAESRRMLDQVDANVIGVVLNKYNPRKDWDSVNRLGYYRQGTYSSYRSTYGPYGRTEEAVETAPAIGDLQMDATHFEKAKGNGQEPLPVEPQDSV